VIRTSHVGTLPRPEQLDALCTRFELPRDDVAFTSLVPRMIADVVRKQAELGLTIVNDGEFGKRGGFSYYAQTRLSGIESRPPEATPAGRSITARDALEFPGYYRGRKPGAVNRPMFCTGPLKYVGQAGVQFDIENVLRAAKGLDVQPFLSAVAPGTIEHWLWNEHYKTDEQCLFAIADAMHEEYKSITDAGILLQIWERKQDG
jgi:5-methyltetrahydropteroyltriglutamate--homocysteine methyltransferase